MGQTFQFIAPCIRRSVSWWGKLLEIMFDGSGNELVRLVAVPILPQCSTQQSRSASPLGKGDRRHPDQVGGQPTRRKFGGQGAGSNAQGTKRLRSDAINSNTRRCTSFMTLPTEIQELVFDLLGNDDIEDVVCLGMTNSYFWPMARKRLHMHLLSFLGCWAGENIVCPGEYLEPGDFPPGLFSAEEEEQLRQTKIVPRPDPDGYDTDDDQEPRLITLCDLTDGEPERHVSIQGRSFEIYFNCVDRDSREYLKFTTVFRDFTLDEPDFYPNDETWILRNLTTHEYVRPNALVQRRRGDYRPYFEYPGFGEVMISRISWSSSSINKTSIHRGPWAGHRFDITTWSRHEEEALTEQWSDISEKIWAEMSVWKRTS